MTTFAEKFSLLIADEIERCGEEFEALALEDVDDKEYIASETIGEVVDKLIILHVRMWHLVDTNASVSDSVELARIGEKMRHIVNVKRPRLIAALNQMLAEAIKGRLDLVDDLDVKHFGGAQ